MDPLAKLPERCRYCRRAFIATNPGTLQPVSRDMKDLAKMYLYEGVCSDCKRRGR